MCAGAPLLPSTLTRASASPASKRSLGRRDLRAPRAKGVFKFKRWRLGHRTECWEWAGLFERRQLAPPSRCVGFPPAPGRRFQIWGRASGRRATNGRRSWGGRQAEGGACRGAGLRCWRHGRPGGGPEGRQLPPVSPAPPLERVREWRGPSGAERDRPHPEGHVSRCRTFPVVYSGPNERNKISPEKILRSIESLLSENINSHRCEALFCDNLNSIHRQGLAEPKMKGRDRLLCFF